MRNAENLLDNGLVLEKPFIVSIKVSR